MPIDRRQFERDGRPAAGRPRPGLGPPADRGDGASARARLRAAGHQLRVGLDVVLDLIPVVGDVITAAMGAWMVWEARNLGMSKCHLARMGGNVGFDFLLGAIPLGRRPVRLRLPLEHAAT